MTIDISGYIEKLTTTDKEICEILEKEINSELKKAESKTWHGHPVWFLDGNPVVGFSKRKACINLMFWSGQTFNEPGLSKEGSFKAAEIKYTNIDQINTTELNRWLKKSRDIQRNYKNIVKRRGVLERLK